MSRLQVVVCLCCLMLSVPGFAQFETKSLEFPEYGFKIPFFSKATRTVYDAGKPEERIEYAFSYTEKGKLFAFLRIYPNAGCYRADSLYSQSERFVRHYDGKPSAFRILTFNGNTYPFGWTGYFATAVVDGPNSTQLASRDYQAFVNGKVLFTVDIISQQFSFMEVCKPILDDPGYNSILLPHNLSELNLRLYTRGNVKSHYEASEKKYYFGRCDQLGNTYPYASFARLNGDVAGEALAFLGEARQMTGAGNAAIETLPAENHFSRLSGQVYLVSCRLKSSDAEGEMRYYFFSFNNSSYVACLTVPFVKDDNKVYGYLDNEISEKSVGLFDERLREMIATIEKIR